MAVLSILGGLLGAGGSIGGGLIGAESQPDQLAPGSLPLFNPGRDPVTAGLSLQNLALLGIFDPSLIQAASPLEQIKNLLASGSFPGGTGDLTGGEKLQRRQNAPDQIMKIVEDARRDGINTKAPFDGAKQGFITPERARTMTVDEILAVAGTKDSRSLRKSALDILAASGYSSLEELFRAEENFKTQIQPVLKAAQEQAERSRQATSLSQQKQFELLQNLPDASAAGIASLRDAELARQDELFKEFERNVLRSSNATGFNPAGGLIETARLRDQGDTDALSRAISLILGQQEAASQSAGLLQGLDPSRFGLPLAQNTSQIRVPVPLGGGIPASPGAISPVGAGVAQGAAQFGDTLTTLGFLNQLNRSNAPAT